MKLGTEDICSIGHLVNLKESSSGKQKERAEAILSAACTDVSLKLLSISERKKPSPQ
ncbi:unnamed protein product [Natator depressus]